MSTADVVVSLRGVSKTYRVYRGHGRGRVLAWLLPFLPPERFMRENEALRGVDLSIQRGEVLGILGRNGSGKSTLLRLVAGLSWPTRGTVEVNGRVRSLLALGVGFHPRFTGRENVLFGSLAMGIPRKIAVERMDSIIDFAEIREHIDVPIQYYSSGMMARLAAAVAFQEAPEILIIDEALAAGDAYFTTKCTKRIEEICATGSTVLFVSHTLALVERLCTRAVLLEAGRVAADGIPTDVAGEYRHLLVEQQIERLDAIRPVASKRDAEPHGAIELVGAWMCGSDGRERRIFDHGEPLEVRLRIRTREPVKRTRFYFELYSDDLGIKLAEIGSNYQSAKSGAFAEYYPEGLDGEYELCLRWPENPLGSGNYYWNVFFARPAEEVKVESELFYHFHARRVCGFRSTSFPGVEWAKWRLAILEPPTEFGLERIEGVRDGTGTAHASPSR